jgi:hypothetical protein
MNYFQKNIFPSIGENYKESNYDGPAYHEYFSHIIIDQKIPMKELKIDWVILLSIYLTH